MSRRPVSAVAASLVLLGLALAPGAAHAADPASVDRAFGHRGVVDADGARAIVATRSGETLEVLDGLRVRRRLRDGRPDRRFGRAGITRAVAPGVRADAIAVGPGGGIFVAGQAPRAPSVAVAKLGADGRANVAFASGVAHVPLISRPGETVVGAVADSSGAVIVALAHGGLIRLAADGRQDPTYAPALPAPIDASLRIDGIRAAADGRLLVEGTILSNEPRAVPFAVLERVGADGRPDATFGGGGTLSFGPTYLPRGIGDVLEAADGTILEGGERGCPYPFDDIDCALEVRRFTADGAPASPGPWPVAADVTRDGLVDALGSAPHDRYLVAGSAPVGFSNAMGSFTVARLSATGRTQRGFGVCGLVAPHLPVAITPALVFAQPSGRIVVAGLRRRRPADHRSGPMEIAALRGGDGRTPTDSGPRVPPDVRDDPSADEVGSLRRLQIRYQAPIHGRLDAVMRIVGLTNRSTGRPYHPLTDDALRRLRLPRTVASAGTTVRPCAHAQATLHLAPQVRRRMTTPKRAFTVEITTRVANHRGALTRHAFLAVDHDGHVGG